MTSLRQQLQQQPQVCVAPPWLSTLLSNCHDCYCTSREGTGIFLVRGAGTSALTGTIPNPLCTVRRGAAQWGCPLAPVKAVLWSTWGGACSRGVWCHGAVPTGVCRGLLCRLWLWCLNPWECLRSGTAMREGSAGKQKHSGTWESSQGLRERACAWGNPATVC